MAFPGERLFESDPPLHYYFEPALEDGRHLCVGFSAFPAIDKPPTYNYVRNMREVTHCHRLWILDDVGADLDGQRIGCYYLGRDRTFDVERAAHALIAEVAAQHDVPPERTICFGSSKGGTAALWFALRGGYGHAISGGPQILLGQYLLHQFPPYEVMAHYIAGDRPDTCAYLDGLFPTAIAEAVQAPDLRIHVGRNDPHWVRHVEPLTQMLDAHAMPYTLDLQEYSTHGELGIHFPLMLRASIAEITGHA